MTLSVVALDTATGQIGVVTVTAIPGGAALVPHVAADAGAIAAQGRPEASSGADGLAMLRAGKGAEAVVAALMRRGEDRGRRQIVVADVAGQLAARSGSDLPSWSGDAAFPFDPRGGFALAGNSLAGSEVMSEAARTFSGTPGALALRFIAAMRAAAFAGGDRRGLRSAAMLIRDRWGAPVVAMSVDDDPNPVEALARRITGEQGAAPAPAGLDVRRFYDLLASAGLPPPLQSGARP
ncbi:DUF1028 domain-containing protein [Methylobacterium sp. NEAU 140]|uniref:DUF1028 domain-containing protein n=1 Tax=Methylobacterium sp. NEAU 140 TaxID=3064945 RepID=UPI0027336FEC|nr:DUF1028 domain-containing protein [Methylobacterium sp. NEAU 140]MDP4026803.1 DUF1028 domain-containing protein [Methylobacterium sp. NEAU 140]